MAHRINKVLSYCMDVQADLSLCWVHKFFLLILLFAGSFVNIGIKHDFSCINICQVPREVLKTEAEVVVFNTSQGTW